MNQQLINSPTVKQRTTQKANTQKYKKIKSTQPQKKTLAENQLKTPTNKQICQNIQSILPPPIKTISSQNQIKGSLSWLNKFFIYRHESLNKYLFIKEFHSTLDKLSFNYFRQLEQYKKISSKPPSNNSSNNNILPIVQNNVIENNVTLPNQKIRNRKNMEKSKTMLKNKKKFICVGGYPDVIDCLINRGWVKINNLKSQEFDFIWTLKTNDINFPLLKNHQLANHFFRNGQITRKSGLCKNVKNIYYKGIDPMNFFPRCYDLSNKNELEDFRQDYKFTWAMSLLKLFIKDYQNEITTNKNSEFSRFSISTISTAINIIERNLYLFDNKEEFIRNITLLNSLKTGKKYLISDDEWNLIYLPELTNQSNIQDFITEVNNNKPGGINNPIKKSILPKKIYNIPNPNFESISLLRNNQTVSVSKSGDIGVYNPILNNASILKNKIKQMNEENNNKNIKKNGPLAKYLDYKYQIEEILKKLEKNCPQYKLNGFRNIWIMKPSNLSRGRGVTIVDNLNPIEQSMSAINNSGIIVQKYIENPLIVYNRKFDIRQWVLITSLSPLHIWMWKEPYIRFGAEDYKMDDLNNIYSHLTNNSIAKHSSQFLHEKKFEGDMWECEQFSQFLGNGKWKEIHEKIKNAIICSFYACRTEIKHREKSFELFGYDFMIDEDLNIYLIEVNASPALDYSTKITEKLVKEMVKDLIKITVDCENGKNVSDAEIGNNKFVQIFNESRDRVLIPRNVPNKNLLY